MKLPKAHIDGNKTLKEMKSMENKLLDILKMKNLYKSLFSLSVFI